MMDRYARGLIRAETPMLAFALSIATQLLVTILNLGTGVVTARLLGAGGRGELAAIITWPQVLSFLALAGLTKSTAYHVRKDRGEAAGYFAGAWASASSRRP